MTKTKQIGFDAKSFDERSELLVSSAEKKVLLRGKDMAGDNGRSVFRYRQQIASRRNAVLQSLADFHDAGSVSPKMVANILRFLVLCGYEVEISEETIAIAVKRLGDLPLGPSAVMSDKLRLIWTQRKEPTLNDTIAEHFESVHMLAAVVAGKWEAPPSSAPQDAEDPLKTLDDDERAAVELVRKQKETANKEKAAKAEASGNK